MHDIMYSSGRGFHKSQGNSETHQMARIIQLPHRGRKAIIPSGISEIIIRKNIYEIHADIRLEKQIS